MKFGISDGKGFHVEFANGWCVSVQFGPGNYCDNYSMRFDKDSQVAAGAKGSDTAECACIDPNGNMVQLPDFMFSPACGTEVVSNRSTPEQVLRLLSWAAARPAA